MKSTAQDDALNALVALVTGASAPPSNRNPTIGIVREGQKIILPEGMSYAQGCEWLTRQEKAEETNVAIHDTIDCFPLDGMVAMALAMEEVFGFNTLDDRDGRWGPEPPVLIQVTTPNGIVTAPLGNMRPPKWEGGYLSTNIRGASLTVGGQVKRKFETNVKQILTVTRRILKEKSIYKGQAIHLDLAWMEDGNFDPITHAPRYMDITPCDLILNEETDFELATSVMMRIEQSDACKANRIPLKHGAIFQGPYGTGKTMSAKHIATKCVPNGWTFIYLKRADQLSNGLRIAKMYAPAVVFAEDFDQVAGSRDAMLQELSTVIDGVDTKDLPIITIVTTNHLENIHAVMLRPGRIDSVIHFGEPDERAAKQFVTKFGGTKLAATVDFDAVGGAFRGLVPAFICEAVNKAASYAIYREAKSDITGCISTDDLLKAASVMHKQVRLMNKREATAEEKLSEALKEVNNHGRNGLVEEIADAVEARS